MNAEATTVRTTCPYCGVGCGVLATRQPYGSVTVKGDPEHPANFGRLCSKGSALAETLSLDDRLLYPEINGTRASWDDALDLVAARFSAAIAEHGPDSVAFYVSGQILTEDYYVANKLMKGFIGSANIDTNSRLCMASSVAGHRRAFGSDTVPGTYEDLEQADLVVLTGSNLAWCHPVLFQRLEAAKAANPALRIVTIDPRRTATCALADLHLGLAPDTDVALFNGLLSYVSENGYLDEAYISRHTSGFGEALGAAGACDISRIADETGLSRQDIARFYDLAARTEKMVTVYSQGVNQSVVGTDKVNAILNVHLATGRIGRAGMGPFSVTGQPNAMGGREVGGLANMLAAHMALENPDHRSLVQSFWQSPVIAERAGLKAVEMFRAVREGKIKALWIMATNPVDSLPDADGVAEALKLCPFVVVSDVTCAADTLEFAHVALPGAAWGEKDGTVTNSERRISRQRRFLDLPGEARPDWWALSEVARRMGHREAFAYDGPAGIFREHAELSAAGNNGTRDFDIGAMADIDEEAFEELAPFQWPARSGEALGESRFFARGGFYTSDRKARFVAVTPIAPRKRERKYPLVLNTGRIRDQWHTMTRTGKTARLTSHIAEPFAEIHPEDALALGISDASLVEVRSPYGAVTVRAQISGRGRKGTVFVPMHWTDQFASRGRVDAVVAPATDPHSGQPGSKFTPVSLKAFPAHWYGFAVLDQKPHLRGIDYWAIAPVSGGHRLEFAGVEAADFMDLAVRLAGGTLAGAEITSFQDEASGTCRMAFWQDGTLRTAFFFAREPVEVSRAWACGLLGLEAETPASRLRVLAGRPAADMPDNGALVCACYQIGANQILTAARGGACTTTAIGEVLKAGTNCGSCRSEIRSLIETVLNEEKRDDGIAKAG
ncbi:nitrate reductase [Roseibium suaedae]|uniref:Assimilatory nitrate reductase (NADH) alpha subunit apoprotein n=1 Tax=Roseibium suaedae TaxID=735517 RepID=A0A1M7PR30_9HYPH|nr:nitrate reductase [Roseibium suaedae]SHN19691.1 assimilatory nitrate reductase (NADH) alpha subunit apoprotein [Roseibium suaedae]